VVDRARTDEVVRPDLVASPLIGHLIRSQSAVLGILKSATAIVDLGSQDPKSLATICMLIPTINEDMKSCRSVPHTDCGVSLILVLPALSVATLSRDVDLGYRDLCLDISRNRKNPDGQVRGLPSAALLRRRHALDAMLAALTFECFPRSRSGKLR
jgi:hypothetical protein